MIAAVLDVGSLSVLLAVGERATDGRLTVLGEEARVVRLGEGLRETGHLSPEAIERTIGAIRELTAAGRAAGAAVVRGAGTAALRRAEDAGEFLARVLEETGVELEVLDAAREAELSFAGVWTGRRDRDPICVVDVGGGSAEIVVGECCQPPLSVSLPLGALRLAGRFPESAVREIEEHVRATLPSRPGGRDPSTLKPVGVGGTITTLGALDLEMTPYDGRRLEGHVLTRAGLAALREDVAAMSPDERRRHPAIEAGRADVLVHGTIVYEAILDQYGWREIAISPRGLREGLLAETLGTTTC